LLCASLPAPRAASALLTRAGLGPRAPDSLEFGLQLAFRWECCQLGVLLHSVELVAQSGVPARFWSLVDWPMQKTCHDGTHRVHYEQFSSTATVAALLG